MSGHHLSPDRPAHPSLVCAPRAQSTSRLRADSRSAKHRHIRALQFRKAAVALDIIHLHRLYRVR